MSFDHNCPFQSNHCNIWEITEFLLNILASFFVHLIFVLAYFMESLIYLNFCCCNGCSCFWVNVNKSKEKYLVAKIEYTYQHKFKLDARSNGWTKKEVKIFRINSVISQILHWLDWNWQLWPRDIYYLGIIYILSTVVPRPTLSLCSQKT